MSGIFSDFQFKIKLLRHKIRLMKKTDRDFELEQTPRALLFIVHMVLCVVVMIPLSCAYVDYDLADDKADKFERCMLSGDIRHLTLPETLEALHITAKLTSIEKGKVGTMEESVELLAKHYRAIATKSLCIFLVLLFSWIAGVVSLVFYHDRLYPTEKLVRKSTHNLAYFRRSQPKQ